MDFKSQEGVRELIWIARFKPPACKDDEYKWNILW
jgi:hypothetical protein